MEDAEDLLEGCQRKTQITGWTGTSTEITSNGRTTALSQLIHPLVKSYADRDSAPIRMTSEEKEAFRTVSKSSIDELYNDKNSKSNILLCHLDESEANYRFNIGLEPPLHDPLDVIQELEVLTRNRSEKHVTMTDIIKVNEEISLDDLLTHQTSGAIGSEREAAHRQRNIVPRKPMGAFAALSNAFSRMGFNFTKKK